MSGKRMIDAAFAADDRGGADVTRRALRDLAFCGMDVVEMSPPYDHADTTAIAAATIMQHHLQALALRRRG